MPIVARSQQKITGRIFDAKTGMELPFVTISEMEESNVVQSDSSGNYSIEVVNEVSTLHFELHEFVSQQIEVGSQNTINVRLEPNDKIVNLGYRGAIEKLTSASYSSLKNNNVTFLPQPNVISQLQGLPSGVIITGSGESWLTPNIRIRGATSVFNNEPLYIVDGVPIDNVMAINPNDIESVTILKDQSTAIYGMRAGSGAVLLTTKKGIDRGVVVNYDTYVGVQQPGKGPSNFVNTKEYAALQWLVYKNDNISETHPIYGLSSNQEPSLSTWAGNTNWYKEMTRPGTFTNHYLSIKAGREDSKIVVSLNYFNQNSILSHVGFKRYNVRINSQHKPKKWLEFGENLQAAYMQGKGISTLDEVNPFSSIYRLQPIIPVVMQQSLNSVEHNFVPGEWGGTGLVPRLGSAGNIVAKLSRNADDVKFSAHMSGNFYAAIKVMQGLKLYSSFGGTFEDGFNSDFTNRTYENLDNTPTAFLREESYYKNDWIFTNTAQYEKQFRKNFLHVLAGVEVLQNGLGRGQSSVKSGYFSEDVSYRTLDNGEKIESVDSYLERSPKFKSSFVTLDYINNQKYLLNVIVRKDGESLLGKGYTVNPAVSVGWRVTEEAFLKNNGIMNNLKIRGGYGFFSKVVLGDTGVVNYDAPSQINVGMDAELLNGKFHVSWDVYKKKGSDKNTYTALNRTGLDLQIRYAQRLSSVTGFNADLIFNTVKNTLGKVDDTPSFFGSGSSVLGYITRNQEGHAPSAFFGYEVEGLFQSVSEVSKAAIQAGAEPGVFKYRDLNNDGTIDADDRTFIGNPNPAFVLGLILSGNYKNFDASIFVYGSYGNDIFNYTKWWTDFWPGSQGQKNLDLLNGSWTPDHTSASVPKASNKSNFSTNTVVNSYYIEDGSFTRLKNIQIGYSVPHKFLKPIGLIKARVYAQGINMITLTRYSGLEPEFNSSSDFARGIDYGNYPKTRQYVFGVNIQI